MSNILTKYDARLELFYHKTSKFAYCIWFLEYSPYFHRHPRLTIESSSLRMTFGPQMEPRCDCCTVAYHLPLCDALNLLSCTICNSCHKRNRLTTPSNVCELCFPQPVAC